MFSPLRVTTAADPPSRCFPDLVAGQPTGRPRYGGVCDQHGAIPLARLGIEQAKRRQADVWPLEVDMGNGRLFDLIEVENQRRAQHPDDGHEPGHGCVARTRQPVFDTDVEAAFQPLQISEPDQ